MRKTNKKGFTLVELLVVIAIVAILATVAIVGYTSFTNKAHESNDRTLVAQLNTAVLRGDGQKYTNPYEAFKAVDEAGFDVAKIKATAKDHAILWDNKNGEFFYSADDVQRTEDVWIVSPTVHETYYTYLVLPEYGEVTVKATNRTKICVVTDGRNLIIDTPLADVYHYGNVADLTIENVYSESYHEYGNVGGYATIKKGHIQVEASGSIGNLLVYTTNAEDVKLTGTFGRVVGTEEVITKLVNNGLEATTDKVESLDELDELKNYTALIEETGVYYNTFKEALAAHKDGQKIVLLVDVALDAPVEVTNKLVLDLNGNTLSYDSAVMGEAMIANKGNLTINDSVGGGVINYNYTGAADPSYGKGNYTIDNAGTLTVNGGKITIANLRGHAKYPINNNSTTGDAILVINGGHLYNYNTSAIRMFCNSTTNKNSVTINGGLIEGYSAIWVQNPGSATVNADLTITGGEIRTTASAWLNGTSELKDVSSALYFTISGNGGAWSEASFVAITGGTFNENVNLAKDAPSVTVTGGTFNGLCEK